MEPLHSHSDYPSRPATQACASHCPHDLRINSDSSNRSSMVGLKRWLFVACVVLAGFVCQSCVKKNYGPPTDPKKQTLLERMSNKFDHFQRDLDSGFRSTVRPRYDKPGVTVTSNDGNVLNPKRRPPRKPQTVSQPATSNQGGSTVRPTQPHSAPPTATTTTAQTVVTGSPQKPTTQVVRPDPTAPTRSPRCWAVVIGVSEYRDHRITPLRYANRDAREFHAWLTSAEGGRYSKDSTMLLVDEQATSSKIRHALFDWLGQAQEEDLVVIFVSSHGTPASPDPAAESDKNDNLFLVTHDAEYDAIASTCFPMWDIKTALDRFVRARRVVVIADACHAGGIGSSFETARKAITVAGASTRINQGLRRIAHTSEHGLCMITSASARQLSQESEKWGEGHGVFTYYLLEALRGKADANKDNAVTLGELIAYLPERVRQATFNAQSPQVAGTFDPTLTLSK